MLTLIVMSLIIGLFFTLLVSRETSPDLVVKFFFLFIFSLFPLAVTLDFANHTRIEHRGIVKQVSDDVVTFDNGKTFDSVVEPEKVKIGSFISMNCGIDPIENLLIPEKACTPHKLKPLSIINVTGVVEQYSPDDLTIRLEKDGTYNVVLGSEDIKLSKGSNVTLECNTYENKDKNTDGKNVSVCDIKSVDYSTIEK